MEIPERKRHPLEYIQLRSLKYLSDQLQSLVKGRLWLKILIGMLLGVAVGIVLGPSVRFVKPDISVIIGEWLSVPGYIFLGLLQMIVIPLVFASIIRGIAASCPNFFNLRFQSQFQVDIAYPKMNSNISTQTSSINL